MNPFDDESGRFFVLVDAEGRHSLWPAFRPAPAGWTVIFGPGSRADALSYVEDNWPDIVPWVGA